MRWDIKLQFRATINGTNPDRYFCLIDDAMETIGIFIALIPVIFLGVIILKYGYIGALFLFWWSLEQGFVGAAAYFACWIFLFPFMLTASIIVGGKICWSK